MTATPALNVLMFPFIRIVMDNKRFLPWRKFSFFANCSAAWVNNYLRHIYFAIVTGVRKCACYGNFACKKLNHKHTKIKSFIIIRSTNQYQKISIKPKCQTSTFFISFNRWEKPCVRKIPTIIRGVFTILSNIFHGE